MKKTLIQVILGIFAVGMLAGCSGGAPTSDAQMDRYKENEAKAQELGAPPPPDQAAENN